MNRNSVRTGPMPTAPSAMAATVSPGCSMLASSSTFWRAKPFGRVLQPRRPALQLALALFRRIRPGDVKGRHMTPASPSTDPASWRTSWLAETRAHHGSHVHAARHDGGVWLVLPPASVTKPANTQVELQHVGRRQFATSNSAAWVVQLQILLARCACAAAAATGVTAPRSGGAAAR